jgi:hypothetical protein
LKKDIKKQIKEDATGEEKKVYSQKQYDEAVRNAAERAATDAVRNLRSLDKKEQAEAKKMRDQIGQIKVPKKDASLEIEKAIKVAVTMEEGVVEPKLDDEVKTPISGADIMAAMESVHKDPVGNGLSAASATGVELARQ